MVNEGFARGRQRLPLEPDGDGHVTVPNPKAGSLTVGDKVKPNFRSAQARRNHQPGMILEIENDQAVVRWQDWTAERRELSSLTRDSG